jgi:hypothetical protein
MPRGMRVDFAIVHDGEARTVTAGPVSIVAFERKWGVGFISMINQPHVEHLAWLAHDALHKQAVAGNGPSVKPFDVWLAGLTDLRVVNEGEESVPLVGTP